MSYQVKAGDTLSGIATANHLTVDQLVALNHLIAVGQVLKVADDPVVPAPTPVGNKLPVGTWLWFDNVGTSTTNNSNLIVQQALTFETGLNYSSGAGVFGPNTSAAYKKWQETLFGPGPDSDGLPGKTSLEALGKKYGFEVRYRAVAPSAAGEPIHNYTRTTYDGQRVNQRTKDMLNTAAAIFGSAFPLTQGSYNAGGVAASAGTHDGGGVVDVGLTSAAAVQALRKAGFAAWQRTPDEGFAYHIHAVAIGDREMSPSAKNQITSYFNGRNGLANNAKDPVARPWPEWVNKYKV